VINIGNKQLQPPGSGAIDQSKALTW